MSSPIDVKSSSPAAEGSRQRSGSPVEEDSQPKRDDDEEEEEDEDEDDGSRPRRPAADDDDEEDEDEDEEEEEDRPRDSRGNKRKAKKQKRNRFIDIEAEVDDEDEDLDEDEDDYIKETADFIDHDANLEEPGADARRVGMDHQLLDRRRREFDDRDAERIAEEFRERHGRSQAARFKGDQDQVPQRLLMPSVDDPNLWQVRVKAGRERDIIFSIMRKSIDLEYSNSPLEVFSAFQRDSLPGLIYIEARSVVHVEAAIKGLVGVYVSRGINLVPIEEMSSLLKLKKKVVEIIPGSWVRIKRGKYAGDLAQVIDITENGEEVGLRFIPRIDLSPKEENLDGKKRKKGVVTAASVALAGRPTPKFFSHEEVARAYGGRSVVARGKQFVFQGETYTKDGFIEKDFKITGISTEHVDPTLEEITRFAGAGQEQDLSMIAEAARKAAIVVLQPGDVVEVFEGEQTGLLGTVDSIAGETVTIKATHGELKGERIEVPGRSVRKNFKPGDHVKVMTGRNVDETGMVVSVAENIVTFLSDLSLLEVTVFAKDIREASEVGNGMNNVGQYQIHDLVQIDAQMAGVIFKTERDTFKVIDQNGAVSTKTPRQISLRRDANRALAVDHDNQEIKVGDAVKEIDGTERKGSVLQIYQSMFVFVHNREILENGGIFVVRARNLRSASAARARGLDTSKLNPAFQAFQVAPSAASAGTFRGPKDPLVGCHVVIVKGINKSLIGTIKDINGDKARVELQSGNKTIDIPKLSLMKKDLLTGKTSPLLMAPPLSTDRLGGQQGMQQMQQPNQFMPPPVNPNFGRTPNPYANDGGRTPAYAAAGRTPNPYAAAGGATPAWNAGAATPRVAGGATPAWNAGSATPRGAGGRTPAYGGGRTPAWASDARTPAGAGGSSRTPAGAGGSAWGATPAGAGSSAYSTTPAESSYTGGSWASSAETPAYGGAYTPAASAPTPGVSSASTPGVYSSAPTPGAYGGAPTPGVFAAPTPGGPSPYASTSAYTPGGNYGPTPGAYSQTPGASYATPAFGAPTPAAGRGHGAGPSSSVQELAADWMIGLKDVMVKIVSGMHGDHYQRGSYNDRTGILLDTRDRNSKDGRTVLVQIGSENHNIGTDFLVPVEPDSVGQLCVAVKGVHKGKEMKTLYANDDDWQVEVGNGGEKVVVNRRELCKRSSTSS